MYIYIYILIADVVVPIHISLEAEVAIYICSLYIANVVVLISHEGHTITREGGMLLELAHSCSSALRR